MSIWRVKSNTERQNILSTISKVESQIYDFEGSYLKETGAYGNAVKVVYNSTKLLSFIITINSTQLTFSGKINQKRLQPILQRNSEYCTEKGGPCYYKRA